MLATTPTTLLEAVNLCLATIGETPVNSVEDNGVLPAVMALQTISNISRAVQTKGWHWNKEENYSIAPTYPEGYIKPPKNCLNIDTSGPDVSIDVVQRGDKLYDRERHTFEFFRALTVDLTLLLDFEELPEAARWYIAVSSARKFQENQVGSADLSNFSLRDELTAKVTLENQEAELADYNINANPDVLEVTAR